MRCASDLVKLRDSITYRVRRLRALSGPAQTALDAQSKRALAYITIELDNLVILGLRQYTKSCLLGARSASGARVITSVAPQSSEHAAALVFRSLNQTGYQKRGSPGTIMEKDEIVFRDPKRAEKVLSDYTASNLVNLQLALSLNAEVFSEIRVVRHFFAHRAKNTFQEVRVYAANLGILSFESPEDVIAKGRPSTGVRILDGWLSDVETFFDLAT